MIGATRGLAVLADQGPTHGRRGRVEDGLPSMPSIAACASALVSYSINAYPLTKPAAIEVEVWF